MAKPEKIGVGFGIMILREEKVLLGKRHEDPRKAGSALHGEGTWTMPGGKLDVGETFEEGAVREIMEETGLEVKKKDLKLMSIANDIEEDAHFVTIGFLCEEINGDPKVMEPDAITKWDWFELDDLPSPVYKPSQKILDHYKNKSIYTPA